MSTLAGILRRLWQSFESTTLIVGYTLCALGYIIFDSGHKIYLQSYFSRC